MPRVVHFEFFADDPVRAVSFYQTVFGWEAQKWDQPYWLITTGAESEPGINGAIAPRSAGFSGVVNTIAVPNLDESIDRIVAAGGSVVQPRSAIPGIGWLAYCRDTEGNLFGILQADEKAR